MEVSGKAYYDAPLTTVFELKSEGVICTSDPLSATGNPEYIGFGDEESM